MRSQCAISLRRVLAHWNLGLVAGLIALVTLPAVAQVIKRAPSSLDAKSFADPSVWTSYRNTSLESLEQAIQNGSINGERAALLAATARDFQSAEGGSWTVIVDGLSGTPSNIEGSGIALDYANEGLLMQWLDGHAPLFGLESCDLKVIPEATGAVGDMLYHVTFGAYVGEIPVEGARLELRFVTGRLVQIAEALISLKMRTIPTSPSLSADEATNLVGRHIGGFQAEDQFVGNPNLSMVPVSVSEARTPQGPTFGQGLDYRLVYTVRFHRDGEMGMWEAKVDAHSGQILSFGDANRYGHIQGSVYPRDNFNAPDGEVPRVFPFADYAPSAYADQNGNIPTGPSTSTLQGRYVAINDTCGAISLSDANGNINFGASGGTDCATPGFGGAGNTRSSRTQYYGVNLIKMKAMHYLPTNTWLQGQVMDKVNLNQTCNAYWDGSALNFFRSGGGCNNTGEIPGVGLHEWGHGMDSNDGTTPSATDYGTGETYGDFTATLQTHESCTGGGFYQSGNCSGYGASCTNCTGIRDSDYAKHTPPTPLTPAMLHGPTGFSCTTAPPVPPTYIGPCGSEGHCESYIASEALWDLAARDLPVLGIDPTTAWQLMDRLWYESRGFTNSNYACTPPIGPADGCAADSLYSALRLADDDDGNLSNGTPHASAIYDAFNRHGIACSSTVNTNSTICPSLAAPTLVGSTNQPNVPVSWNAISGASAYSVLRNESGCGAGYAFLAKVDAPATSYTDAAVVAGMTYYYRVQAVGSNERCVSPVSNCFSSSVAACATPNSPTSLTATPGTNQITLSWLAPAGLAARAPESSTEWARGNASPSGVPGPKTGETNPCVLPGKSVGTDPTGDQTGAPQNSQSDLEEVWVAELCQADSIPRMYFDIKVNNLSSIPPSAKWYVLFMTPDSVQRWVDMESDAAGAVTYKYGTVSGTTYTTTGTITNGKSSYKADGTITIVIENSLIGNVASGDVLQGVHGDTRLLVGILLVSEDTSTGANYALQGNASCCAGGNTPPTAALSATPLSGQAPLAVAFDASGSSDPDAGDHVAQYRFTFGDGTSLTSGNAMVSHTYTVAGTCTASVVAIDTHGAASTNSATRAITVSSPTAGGYNIYRAAGACPQSAYQLIASNVQGTSFVDTPVSANVTYSYVVRATDIYDVCESGPSNCASATATGSCTAAPTFSGLQSAASAGLDSSCGITLSWNSATPYCGSGVYYTIYRSQTPNFAPSTANLLASGVSGTTYWDINNLQSGDQRPRPLYYYVVRAADNQNGAEDTNTVAKSAFAAGPASTTTFFDGGEAGARSMDLTGQSTWSVQTGLGHTGTAYYGTPNYGDSVCASMVTPPLSLSSAAQLSFWSECAMEVDVPPGTASGDKGLVRIATGPNYDTWQRVELTPDYPYTVNTGGDACGFKTGNTYFAQSLIGEASWKQRTADLSAYAGKDVRIAFTLSSDPLISAAGWSVDDIQITNVLTYAACANVAPRVHPVPDGGKWVPGTAMNAAKIGSTALVTWTVPAAPCANADYEILYGNGSQVSAYGLSGAACGIGASGSYSWSAPSIPSGESFLWFVVVGTDAGKTLEGSWGKDSLGRERHPLASGACGVSSRDNSNCQY